MCEVQDISTVKRKYMCIKELEQSGSHKIKWVVIRKTGPRSVLSSRAGVQATDS